MLDLQTRLTEAVAARTADAAQLRTALMKQQRMYSAVAVCLFVCLFVCLDFFLKHSLAMVMSLIDGATGAVAVPFFSFVLVFTTSFAVRARKQNSGVRDGSVVERATWGPHSSNRRLRYITH